jgi:hypothetical protein
VPPKNDGGGQGRESNPRDDKNNLPGGILPSYTHPHGRSYNLLSELLKTAFCPMSGALLTGAGAMQRHYTGLGMSDALNLIKIAPPAL